MQIKMTIDECLEFADEWASGCTFHEGSQGWRVVCMLLAEEVRKLRGEPMPDGEGVFKYHGYSGNCPKPPLPKQPKSLTQDELDATRYRWLREKMFCNETGYLDIAEIHCNWHDPRSTEIDCAIDAAMTPNA